MLPVLQMSALCDGLAQDPVSKKISLIGLFDMILQPMVMPQFFVFNHWVNGEGTFTEVVEILAPDLTPVAPTPPQEFTLPARTSAANIINGFVNFNFAVSGVYWIQVKLNGELVLAYPLPVLQSPDVQIAVAAPTLAPPATP